MEFKSFELSALVYSNWYSVYIYIYIYIYITSLYIYMYMYVHAVMDWSRESNRQQCQQATPTGPAPHCTTLHHTVPHCTTLCHYVPQCTTLYHTVWSTLCLTVPHCITTYFHSFSTFLCRLFSYFCVCITILHMVAGWEHFYNGQNSMEIWSWAACCI